MAAGTGLDCYGIVRASGDLPEDALPGEKSLDVEGAFVLVIARLANASDYLCVLAVGKIGRLLAFFQVQADTGASAGGEFEGELLAVFAEPWRINDAAAERDCFSGCRIQFGFRRGCSQDGRDRTGEQGTESHAGPEKHPGFSQVRQECQSEKEEGSDNARGEIQRPDAVDCYADR